MAKKEFSLESLDQQDHKPKDTGIPQRGNEKAKAKPPAKAATAAPTGNEMEAYLSQRIAQLNVRVTPTAKARFAALAKSLKVSQSTLIEAMIDDWETHNRQP